MGSPNDKKQTAVTFQQVYDDELQAIKQNRESMNKDDPLMGLALSGGGIRSATFNLGVIQGLAEQKVFDKFDYLSTVSGGGYIGSWLSAWIYHKDQLKKDQESQPNKTQDFIKSNTSIQDDLSDSIDANSEMAKPVKFLRNYSNYLTPRVGLFTMDTLSAVANYTRNLILNQSILILTLALVLMIPRFLQNWGDSLQNIDHFWFLCVIDALCLLVSVGMIAYNLIYTRLKQTKEKAKNTEEESPAQKQTAPSTFGDFVTSSDGVFIFIVIPVLISSWLTALILFNLAKNPTEPLFIILGTGLIYLAFWVFAYLISSIISKEKQSEASDNTISPDKLLWAGCTFVAGCIGGGLFLAVVYFLASLYAQNEVIIHWLIVVFGPPVIGSIFALIVVFHIGLMGREFSVAQHEWWNRIGAPLIMTMIAWSSVFGIAVFGPSVLDWMGVYLSATLTSGWIASTIAGVLAGKSSTTGEKSDNVILEFVAQIAPYIFIIGMLIAVSSGLQWAYSSHDGINKSVIIECPAATMPCFSGLVESELDKMDKVTGKSLGIGFLSVVIVVVVLAWRVKLNLFSLHNFYRNRLTRAYLGASRPDRNPHPFTGFDEYDDIALSELSTQRPYHIINAAINLTNGSELSVQDRKASSFVFTPKYCGYQLDNANLNLELPKPEYYRKSEEYGKYDKNDKNDKGFRLGSAIAVSGAAVNPNMGFHSSPPVAFLLTMFNVRLGRWCGNPQNESDAWKESDPMFGLKYLLSELFGYSSIESKFVNLSDGGHFENLGLYELVRRQCKHIVVCDAGADENFIFEDLAGAIRKCRTDFGVEIKIDSKELDKLRHNKQHSLYNEKHYGRYSEKHYVIGTIHYGNYWENQDGTLIILKPSLTEAGLPAEVQNYAEMDKCFPQQSTADQWFDEAQFESYRKLGHHVVQSLFADLKANKGKYGF
jgi:hypothetical protein